MNGLDLLLVLVVVAYGLSGYQQGFVVGAGSTAGLLLGGYVGARLTPSVLDRFDPSRSVSFTALAFVLVCALVGRAVGAFLGRRVRTELTWRPARVVDALSGAALSVVAVLLIAWVLGVAVTGVQVRPLNAQVRSSAVLGTIDRVLPGGSSRVLAAFNSLVDSSVFPRYLEPFAPEHIKAVPRPTRRILRQPGVHVARSSVVKILGAAPACGRGVEGSGFVYDTGRVMTNAHVVAGVHRPLVELNGTPYRATVVYYDPDVDVAVLSVRRLTASALRFGGAVRSGTPAAVLGFPENGPYEVSPARVRSVQTLRSPDIYGDGTVHRETYSLYAQVRPGNSGGPVVNRRGAVVGVVFAGSITDPTTAYALTADQVATAAREGESSSSRVDTGRCVA